MIREKSHRLPPTAYRGFAKVAFTINTAERKPYFSDAEIIPIAIGALEESFIQNGGHAGVFVFMPDHMHLMVSGNDQRSDLLALIQKFKQKTTFRTRKLGKPFAWQKDFYDHIIRANEDYGAQVRYLLRNPVRKELCRDWTEWPHRGVLGQTWEQLALNIGTL